MRNAHNVWQCVSFGVAIVCVSFGVLFAFNVRPLAPHWPLLSLLLLLLLLFVVCCLLFLFLLLLLLLLLLCGGYVCRRHCVLRMCHCFLFLIVLFVSHTCWQAAAKARGSFGYILCLVLSMCFVGVMLCQCSCLLLRLQDVLGCVCPQK